MWFNYGKRGCLSATFDLQSERGHELFLELVKQSDVFLENNAANVVDTLGIGWDVLHAANPRLIMVRFPGFGITGPYAHHKGIGTNMEAVAGHTMVRGYADERPVHHAQLAAQRPERRHARGVGGAGRAAGPGAHRSGAAGRAVAGRGGAAPHRVRRAGLRVQRP